MKNSNTREIVDVIAITEIIDDAGLVLCINRLNALKEPGNEQQIGFNIEKIGPEIEYRGKRTPYKSGLKDFLSEVQSKSPQVSNLFSRNHLAFRHASVLERALAANNWLNAGNYDVAAHAVK